MELKLSVEFIMWHDDPFQAKRRLGKYVLYSRKGRSLTPNPLRVLVPATKPVPRSVIGRNLRRGVASSTPPNDLNEIQRKTSSVASLARPCYESYTLFPQIMEPENWDGRLSIM